ncbi:hypothetical protein G5I_07551 [Acromyrmex echinatior]|uniref:Uncharacterized protein n=1 Tax=Acromyrmex echinatior TaxID=103372 RepID=F4WP41_ACREC|nr:hypothetical protein G5I_07551 [Acromyrmex echinatior]
MLDVYEITAKSWFLNQLLAFVIIGAARREDSGSTGCLRAQPVCASQNIRTRGLVLIWDVAPLDWIGLFYWIAAIFASQRGANLIGDDSKEHTNSRIKRYTLSLPRCAENLRFSMYRWLQPFSHSSQHFKRNKSHCLTQESANYAKTWRSASRFVQYIAPDRFSWSPLKYHAVWFTAVHSVRRSAYILSREDRSILKLRGFLAGGLSFPQVCCQNIGNSW